MIGCFTTSIVLRMLARKEGSMKCFCDDRIVCVAGRAWDVCVDSGGHLLYMYSIIWSYSEQKPKRGCFRLYDGLRVTSISGNIACWRGLITLP